MAKGRKTGGRDFKKGKPGGPGRPSLDADIRAIRESVRKDLHYWYERCSAMGNEELLKSLKDPYIPAFARGVAKSIYNFRRTGNWKNVEYPIDQLIGKPKQSLDLAGGIIGPISIEIIGDDRKDNPGEDSPETSSALPDK